MKQKLEKEENKDGDKWNKCNVVAKIGDLNEEREKSEKEIPPSEVNLIVSRYISKVKKNFKTCENGCSSCNKNNEWAYLDSSKGDDKVFKI